MNKVLSRVLRIFLEVSMLLALVLITWHVGENRLDGWTGPAGSLTNDLFVPAVMMNAGQGFVNVEPSDIPPLRAFLDFQVQEFDLDLVRGEMAYIPLHPYQEFHRYLIYTVALAWRCFGVTWDGVKILILVYFVLAALFVYGICRLGMNPLFSLAASTAFVFSNTVLWTLPILRDFVKAPFILAVILVLGLALRKKFSTGWYLALAAVAGLLLGVGMGFRRDMMVFLPIVLLIFLVCGVKPGPHRLLRRVGAILIIAMCYVAAGLPVHLALAREGYVAAHDTIMGFASYSDQELGVLNPASYEKHYLLNDLYCTLKAHDAARRGLTFPTEVYAERRNEPEYDREMKSAYVLEMAMTFPADMLTRAYAAVLRLSTGVIPARHSAVRFIEKWGLWFVFAGLLILAVQQPIQAWLVLALLCYFCGYTSIQFAGRHVFHMSFVPFFFAGITIQSIGQWLLPGPVRRFSGLPARCGRAAWLRGAGTAAVWALITLILFVAPLAFTRAWQRHNVETMRTSYATASAVPIAHRSMEWDGRVVFVPTEGRQCHLCQTMGLIVDINTRHLAASFSQVDEPLDILLVYEWEGLSWDFSAPTTFNLRRSDTPVDMRYFFPVHETTTCTDWNHFVGLSLPVEQAGFFRGFSQVENTDALGLLVNMAVPERREEFIYAQKLAVPWTGGSWRNYRIYEDFNPVLSEMEILGLMNRGEYAKAAQQARTALEARPKSIQFTFLLAEALDQKGQSEEAYEKVTSLLEFYPHTFVLYARLDRYFGERGGVSGQIHEWRSVLEENPHLTCAQYYLDEALRKASGDLPVQGPATDSL